VSEEGGYDLILMPAVRQLEMLGAEEISVAELAEARNSIRC